MGTNPADGAEEMILSPLEMDAIGEVMNISMGSAATAVSQMLDKQVEITTPTVNTQKLSDVTYEQFEPALLVKIVYTVGLDGSNVMVFRQHDMQMILNTLMGIPDPPSDDFVFDELSISAACEVMNQMMGSSSTALADFLNKRIDISTPTASVMEDSTFAEAIDLAPDADVVAITFRLTIKDMLDSEFISVMTVDLVKEIITPFIGQDGDVQQPEVEAATPSEPAAAPAEPAPAAPSDLAAAAAPPPPPPSEPAAAQAPPATAAAPPPPPPAQPAAPAAQDPAAAAQPYAYPAAPPPAAAYPPQAYAYPQAYAAPAPPQVDVRSVEFPDFPQGAYADGTPVMGNNLDLIMNVPLNVSIEIGTTKKKIRDIMNFTSGTVVELDKQAGAPIDIVVNGQLIAHGDVVVIDDNFGVRITEIIGTKELINSLSEQPKQGG
ncbi:flagellar motor switch phosphatase FliY [Ruminococcaceae bacterium OttesenSCG-928-I18]|nr:flagellar motor switch phosphatase FliY [Ruminococcaceae bacterium OttesenSCG-928-I18]